ncbi:hypothetical protein [Metabacillus fastidiosus]|uniref:hypothetical protein n=1 Tax=Metabacillus fastidiosus TaxID=1458 RepID=UPI002DBE4F04|nr:hypothetical protein [Metabacillus fastidiosus]MEC2076328.1 hypothetical protein [Metabacillus fastidiosus]
MLILYSGITGILSASSVKEKEFKQICYSLLGSNVLEFIENGTLKNFYECIIKLKGKNIHILLNRHYPFIAFTSARELNVLYFPFIDEPDLSKLFEQYYKVLSVYQLNEPLTYTQKGKNIIVINENELNQGELKELVFWKPRTIGEVVFNYWD